MNLSRTPGGNRGISLSRLVEKLLLCLGVILLVVFLGARTLGALQSRFALWRFATVQASASQSDSLTSTQAKDGGIVDFSLWTEKRVQAYKQSLLLKKDMPLAVLRIDKLLIRVPVFDGTDDLTLNRGVGRIAGTARPGESGNIGIAGHRDGFFRGLKDVKLGDTVELTTLTEKVTYVVDQVEIVSPSDVHVLQPRAVSTLTLVTCYPFYFVGDAPQRFIVHASIASGQPIVSSHLNVTSIAGNKNNKEKAQ